MAGTDFALDKMLFNIPAKGRTKAGIRRALKAHPEVKFVSLMGVDIGGHDTDEKIPTPLFLKELDTMLEHGVQTDGSSVLLPGIADINNAKLDIIPDQNANWYVDHNFRNIDRLTGLPTGTLRIPSFLLHNDTTEVGSRVILRDAVAAFKKDLLEAMKAHPYVFEELAIDRVEDIEDIVLTSATELEFWVKTPDDKADRREELSTSQVMKEQYWKRTIGPVRTSLEKSLEVLDQYGFEVEMGHKEVGGVKAMLSSDGTYDHVMEQLEVDWKYSTALQAADNENQVKYVIRDVFRMHGLDVTFMAKPLPGVAGSGEHTHLGVAAKLKDGSLVNLFSPKSMGDQYMSPIGYGALMGLLKNYDIIMPFVAATNDSFNRLQPGFEAPVCTVTSLGNSIEKPSRNRTILVGLVREMHNPMGTRFELRSPNPKSNTYLVIASAYMAMLDGIEKVLEAGKKGDDLEKSISKKYGEKDFYLEKNRLYRSEANIFEDYSKKEREKLFGRAPATVWENLKNLSDKKKVALLERDGVMDAATIESYRQVILGQWTTELHNRILPDNMDTIRRMKRQEEAEEGSRLDAANWKKVQALRNELGKDTQSKHCLLKQIGLALDGGDYEKASELQQLMQAKMEALQAAYTTYKKNLF